MIYLRNQEGASSGVSCKSDSGNNSSLPCPSQNVQDDIDFPFEDCESDDGPDPAMKEELDRYASDILYCVHVHLLKFLNFRKEKHVCPEIKNL
jgi:hypothetical protein